MPKLLLVVFGVLFVYWAIVVVIAATTFALAVTGVGEDNAVTLTPTSTLAATASPQPTPTPERPADVPSSAELVTADIRLPAGDDRRFFSLRCEEDLLAVATTAETVFATVDCTDYWLSDDVLRPILGAPVEIRVAVNDPSRLFIDAGDRGVLRFDADAVWIDAAR